VNRTRVLWVMRERSLLVRSRRMHGRRKKEWGRANRFSIASLVGTIRNMDICMSFPNLQTRGNANTAVLLSAPRALQTKTMVSAKRGRNP